MAPKLNTIALDILKSGLNKAIGHVVESLGGSGPVSTPNFSQPRMPDINDADNSGSSGTRAPATDPSKPEETQLHLDKESAPAVRLDPQNLVKSLDKINASIVDYLSVIYKNNTQ
jgi:hypothetical protein